MNLIRKTYYRIIVSYILAVWAYGMIFAFISGVVPATAIDFIKFIVTPFTITIQLPILFMRGSGWPL
jgi:hypothetical protein